MGSGGGGEETGEMEAWLGGGGIAEGEDFAAKLRFGSEGRCGGRGCEGVERNEW